LDLGDDERAVETLVHFPQHVAGLAE